MPLTIDDRIGRYLKQRGDDARTLTPRQCRRINHKANHHRAGALAQGRLRKRYLKRENRRIREQAKNMVAFVRYLKSGAGR